MADAYSDLEEWEDDDAYGDDDPILRTLAHQQECPTVAQLCEVLALLTPGRAYVTLHTRVFQTVMLRRARFPRDPAHRNRLDYDIVQIAVREPHRDRGHATALFTALTEAAQCYGRAVFLEQCITPESVALGNSLVRKRLAVRVQSPGDDTPSFRSSAPV